MNGRSIDIWKLAPEAHAHLKRVPVRELMDPVPDPLLNGSSTMEDVGRAFIQHPHEVFYLSRDGHGLEGLITLSDWLSAVGNGARPETPASQAMVEHPIVVSADDDGALAAGVLREHHLKSVPVVDAKDDGRVVGCLRARRIIAQAFSIRAGNVASLAGGDKR